MASKLKIFCNYRTTDKPWGGANNFVKTLKSYLESTGRAEFIYDIDGDYDILFMNSIGKGPGRLQGEKPELSIRELVFLKKFGDSRGSAIFNAQKRRKKIVFRSVNLDKSAFYRPILSYRDVRVIAAMNIADRVILQTNYMQPIFRRAGYLRHTGTVIHNGADSTIFNTNGREKWDGASPLKVLSASFSDRRTKRFDIIADFSRRAGVECTHIGRWPNEVDPVNVKLLGVLPREQLSIAMKRANVFLHPAERDPCPNVVLEALSTGMPILYSEDSGSLELAEGFGFSINNGPDEALDLVRTGYYSITEKIADHHEQFTIETAAKKYLEAMLSV